ESALRDRVAAFRRRITEHFGADVQAVGRDGSALFELLLGPAAARLKTARRVVVCADGPLHLLPFAALTHQGRFLVECKPLHVVPSATLYAELHRGREPYQQKASVRFVAFGDARPEAKHTHDLAALEGTRIEVSELLRLFPNSAAGYLGRDANESSVRNAAGQ